MGLFMEPSIEGNTITLLLKDTFRPHPDMTRANVTIEFLPNGERVLTSGHQGYGTVEEGNRVTDMMEVVAGDLAREHDLGTRPDDYRFRFEDIPV